MNMSGQGDITDRASVPEERATASAIADEEGCTPATDSAVAAPAVEDGTRDADETREDHEGGLLHVITHPVEHVVEPVVGAVVSAAEPVVGAVGAVASVSEPVVDVMGHVVRVAGRAAGRALVSESTRRRARLRRLNRRPLPNLYEVHPAARDATPHELGIRFVPLDEIRGTAVAGIAQRGSDFRPLPMFQGSNWEGRWKRIRRANERLEPLPPIDLVKFDGGYWVLDGHNRVAAALYDNGAGLDAVVTELVPLDGHVSEAPTLAPLLAEAAELRGGLAAAVQMPFGEARYGDRAQPPTERPAEPDVKPAEEAGGETADGHDTARDLAVEEPAAEEPVADEPARRLDPLAAADAAR